MADQNNVQDSLVDNLVSMYERAPVVRMLVAAHPPAAIAEAGILAVYKWWKHRRLYVFTDEIITLELNPPEEQVRSREFCEAFGATSRRVLETRREEKVRLFARLFVSFINRNAFNEDALETFDEDLAVLDDLGFREFELLLLIHKQELQFPSTAEENQAQRTSRYWTIFQADAIATFKITAAELDAMLQRLVRTGLYVSIAGSFWDYSGGRGYLTPLYESLLANLQVEV